MITDGRPAGPDLLPIRIAAVLYVALSLGFGIGAVWTLTHLRRHGELPMTPFGFRALAGPFEALGWPRFTMLAWSLVAVSIVDLVAGLWLWQGRRRGARLGLATTPITFGLALGFALPFLLVGVPLRAALVILGRRSLR